MSEQEEEFCELLKKERCATAEAWFNRVKNEVVLSGPLPANVKAIGLSITVHYDDGHALEISSEWKACA